MLEYRKGLRSMETFEAEAERDSDASWPILEEYQLEF